MTVKVEQVDRDAAADWFKLTNSLGISHTGKRFEEALRDGSYDGDNHPLVQAFARHRLASQPVPAPDLVERAALILAKVYDDQAIADGRTGGAATAYRAGVDMTIEFWDRMVRAIIPIIQADEREAYEHARRLAVALWEKHFRDQSPEWKPLPDLFGVIDQIDNMTTGLTAIRERNGG